MRFGGNEKSLQRSADLTLSFASFMEALAIPTTLKEGKPLVRVDSTCTILASIPSYVAQETVFININLY
jgi:hypothetical protein